MARRDLDAAEEELRKGRYGEAVERFRSLLSRDPENPDLRSRCADAYRLAGNSDRAFHHYNKGAGIYQRLGDARNALRLLVYANALSPNEPDILFRMAECKRALNDLRDFEVLLNQVVAAARAPGDRRRLWALEELCARNPEDGHLAARRAEVLVEVGRIDDALLSLRAVLPRLDPRQVDLMPVLQRAAAEGAERPLLGVEAAGIMLSQRRCREALILIVPFYEKFPEDIRILETLIAALEGLGAREKVIAARVELIKARTRSGQRDSTLRDVADLIAMAPEEPSALEIAAHAYGVFEQAAMAARVWRTLAQIYERSGRKYDYHRAILMQLRQDPDDADALALGAQALRDAGRGDEAAVLERRLTSLFQEREAQPSPPELLPPAHPDLDRETTPGAAAALPPSPGRAAQPEPRARGEVRPSPSVRASPAEEPHPRDAAGTGPAERHDSLVALTPPLDELEVVELSDDDVIAETYPAEPTEAALADAFSSVEPTLRPHAAPVPDDLEHEPPERGASSSPWPARGDELGAALSARVALAPASLSPTRREGPVAEDRRATPAITTVTTPVISAGGSPSAESAILSGAIALGAGILEEDSIEEKSTDHGIPPDADPEFGRKTVVSPTAPQAGSPPATAPAAPRPPSSSARSRARGLASSPRRRRARPTGEFTLPPEVPTSIEETTSKVAQLVNDEFLELAGGHTRPRRGQSTEGAASPSPEDFADSDTLRSTLRHRLVAELYEEAEKAKKL